MNSKFLFAASLLFCSVLLGKVSNTDSLNLQTGEYEFPSWRSLGNMGAICLLATSVGVFKSEDDELDKPKNKRMLSAARDVSTGEDQPIVVASSPPASDNDNDDYDDDDFDDRVLPVTRISSPNRADDPIIEIAALGHKLLPCSTQSGKTTTIKAAMLEAYKAENGEVDFFILDAKGSGFLGIENNPSRYLLVEDESDVDKAVEFINRISKARKSRMRERQALGGRWTPETKPRRIILILEEFNNVIGFADNFDRLNNDKEDKAKRAELLGTTVTNLLNLASEDMIHLWITGQSHRVGAIKLNTDTQDNLDFFCQGKNGNYQSITRAIAGRYALVRGKKHQDQLLEELNKAIEVAEIEERPVIFSTMGGYKIRVVKDLSEIEKNKLYQKAEG